MSRRRRYWIGFCLFVFIGPPIVTIVVLNLGLNPFLGFSAINIDLVGCRAYRCGRRSEKTFVLAVRRATVIALRKLGKPTMGSDHDHHLDWMSFPYCVSLEEASAAYATIIVRNHVYQATAFLCLWRRREV